MISDEIKSKIEKFSVEMGTCSNLEIKIKRKADIFKNVEDNHFIVFNPDPRNNEQIEAKRRNNIEYKYPERKEPNIGDITENILPNEALCKLTGKPCILYGNNPSRMDRPYVIDYDQINRCPSSKDVYKKFCIEGVNHPKSKHLFFAYVVRKG